MTANILLPLRSGKVFSIQDQGRR